MCGICSEYIGHRKVHFVSGPGIKHSESGNQVQKFASPKKNTPVFNMRGVMPGSSCHESCCLLFIINGLHLLGFFFFKFLQFVTNPFHNAT